MAKKEIRLTYYFADEVIFKLAKKYNTIKRLKGWANAFFSEHEFVINDEPLGYYNETIYKRKFCLQQSNGIKPDLREDRQLDRDVVLGKITVDEIRREITVIEMSSDPPDEKKRKLEDMTNHWIVTLKQVADLIVKQGTSTDYEIGFRKQILPIYQSLALPKERLSIVFCEFLRPTDPVTGMSIRGQTLDARIYGSGMSLWADVNRKWPDAYPYTIVLIDLTRMTPSME